MNVIVYLVESSTWRMFQSSKNPSITNSITFFIYLWSLYSCRWWSSFKINWVWMRVGIVTPSLNVFFDVCNLFFNLWENFRNCLIKGKHKEIYKADLTFRYIISMSVKYVHRWYSQFSFLVSLVEKFFMK